MPATQPAPLPQKFKLDRSTTGGITMLTLQGVLDEGFEGQKVAETVKTKKLLINLRNVRRFASWGMSEWMNFMRGVSDYDLYFIECSAYAVNQMNLVTGLIGHGKLVSFYAPFRCAACGEEFEALMVVPIDRAAIRDIADMMRPCGTCGANARMDKYPASMYSQIADRPVFDIDDEVVAFLRGRFKYDLAPNLTRFRAFRRVQDNLTYIRLSGSMTTLSPDLLARASQGTTIVDLASVVFDPNELASWRSYVRGAMANVTSLQLLDCPPGFLEHGVLPEDLQTKLKVRTFALDYQCLTCETTTPYMVDVAPNLEQLTEGIIPTARCPTCQSVLVPPVTDLAGLLRRLPARENDPAQERFLAKARTEPVTKLEDCLVARPAKDAKAGGISKIVYIGSGIAALLVAGMVVIAMGVWKQRGQTVAPEQGSNVGSSGVTQPTGPSYQRPDWIILDQPASAFCQEAGINRLTCIGVSSYRSNQNDAVIEAADAALDELVNAVALKINAQVFKDTELASYSSARSKALQALQALDTDRRSAGYAAADEVVRKARHRVADILKESGAPAAPTQRSDWYWEEYAIEKGGGTEFLVFVRYDVTLDAVKALVEKYSAVTSFDGGAAITAFPGLAWQYADFTGGAVLTKVGRPYSNAAIAPHSILVSVGDQHVVDAAGLARQLTEATKTPGDLKVTVKTGDGAPQAIDVHR
jgi:hypothetical protein